MKEQRFVNAELADNLLLDGYSIDEVPSANVMPRTTDAAIDFLRTVGWLIEHDKALTLSSPNARVGRWIYHESVCTDDGCKGVVECSACHAAVNEETFYSAEFHRRFCGECGATMKFEEEEKEMGFAAEDMVAYAEEGEDTTAEYVTEGDTAEETKENETTKTEKDAE